MVNLLRCLDFLLRSYDPTEILQRGLEKLCIEEYLSFWSHGKIYPARKLRWTWKKTFESIYHQKNCCQLPTKRHSCFFLGGGGRCKKNRFNVNPNQPTTISSFPNQPHFTCPGGPRLWRQSQLGNMHRELHYWLHWQSHSDSTVKLLEIFREMIRNLVAGGWTNSRKKKKHVKCWSFFHRKNHWPKLGNFTNHSTKPTPPREPPVLFSFSGGFVNGGMNVVVCCKATHFVGMFYGPGFCWLLRQP